jgi:hypothetical protein
MVGQNLPKHFYKPKTYWGRKKHIYLHAYYQTKEKNYIF